MSDQPYFSIDPESGCTYVFLAPGTVASTVNYADVLNVDFDSDGTILGIEIIGRTE